MPSGNEVLEQVAALKELVEYCKASGLPVTGVTVGQVALQIAENPLSTTGWILRDGPASAADPDDLPTRPDPEDVKPYDGSLDGEFARTLGVDLGAGVDAPELNAPATGGGE